MDASVVFSRCAEAGGLPALRELGNLAAVRVYQKAGSCNESARGARTLSMLPAHVLRWLDHNAGDECSAYLQYIVDEYDRLPSSVFFLQYAAEHQLMLPSVAATVRAAVGPLRHLGFVALSRHSFEGKWPAPCEAGGKQATFARCSEAIFRDLGVAIPGRIRFYANGLFAVSRDRVRSRPLGFYQAMLHRLSGRATARCDGPDTRRRAGASSRLVGDCHVLEKAWHIVFQEPPELPPPHEYNQVRAMTNRTLRIGGRFYETSPGGKCAVGNPPTRI